MADLPRFDRRMTDAEGLMWRLEKDPYLSSTFGNVTILDRKVDIDHVRRRLDRATHAIPRLRQRVQPAPANLAAPLWVDDPQFELDYHVRHLALPKPGSVRQLLDLATLIVADPFDRTRPLWQFVLVDGLSKGRSALIQKLHHTITDGVGGVKLSLQFLDVERDAPAPPPITLDDAEATESSEPSAADAMRDLFAGSLRMPIGVIRQIRDLLADPAQMPAASAAAADTVRGIISQLSDVERARSPLWTQRSLHRRLEVARYPLEDAKLAAKRLGGTLNTAFVTAAAHAASEYHRALGSPVEQLRASMTISTRTDSSGTNAFSLARLLVPTGEMPIAERFRAIHEATTAARETSGTASLEKLAAVAASLPTSIITRLARQQTQTVDFATSNVKAAPFPLFLGGAQILENYPVGPLGGVAFNLTLLSYDGSLDMALNIDTAAVSEPERLRRALSRAFDALEKAGT
ncbi:MAG: wax ester/triacylglycerol synthase domain-containing protein [Acidimicrobiia bacterium]